ncbi:mechanosensitive channel MscK [uncultured Tolumonas sp.]|uniref:mechanosensitive channel MscK n=1 Tax=uncultured Tolumonas sp. TaxID=263765 RepID=UPI00292E9F43|nr:mechanosensitive channel MscK [uncultured Tolumonas sp.]
MQKQPLFRSLLSGLLLLASTTLFAAQQQELPTRASLDNKLTALNKRDTLTVAEKAQKDDIEQTITLLDAIDKEKIKLKDQDQSLTKAPAKLKEFARQLELLQKNDAQDTQALKTEISRLTQTQLDGRLTDLLSQLQSAQSDLGNANSQLTFLQTLPERAQSAMSQDYQRMQDIRNRLSGLKQNNGEMTPSLRVKLNTELAFLQLQQEQRQKDLDNNTSQQDLYNKQRDFLTAQIAQLNNWVQLLQQQVSNKRLTLTEKTVEESGTTQTDNSQALPSFIQKELKLNQQLSQQLIDATQGVNSLVQENIKVKNWLDRTTQTEQNLNEQISVLKGSLLLSKILYQQRQMLPDANLVRGSEEQIADLRLAQFDVNQQRDQLYQRNEYIQKLLEKNKGDALTAEQMATLNEALDGRRELLEQLNKQLGQQLNLSINLQLNQQQLERVSKTLQSTLQQQIFWVSSNKPLDMAWLTALPGALMAQWQAVNISANLNNWLLESLKVFPAILLMLIIAGVMIWKRQAIQSRFEKLAKEVGQLRSDTHSHTPKAILLVFLRTIPGALLIMSGGLALVFSGLSTPLIIGELSFRMALAYMAFGSMRRMLKPDGLAQKHFGHDAQTVAHLRNALRYIWYTLLPLIFVATLGELDPSRLANDVVGQIICLVSLLFLSFELFTTVRKRPNNQQTGLWRNITALTFGLVPLILIGLLGFGYYYTALKLSARLIDSFYLVSVWVLLYETSLRGLSVAARRLAYRRALAKRQHQQRAENADGVEVSDDKPITLEQINEQTLRLVTVALTLVFAGAFYWLWSDLVAVIAYLDSITLWHHTVGTDGNAVLEAVSLRDLLGAGVIAMVTYILTRNLPGLLEVLVLSRLQLAQGTSYAITTILSYLLTATGTISTLSIIGMEWNKLQWLVAALSVGLGFGLQEIFANFVSGLIILFERPVRIGDTITVSGFSGTVNKIRIRATTITDFDRKEVIIPNRAFVTERLINWSLSDTITRVVLRIGVSYGSDLELTRRLLLQAAAENPRVMKEPAPSVYFLAFGASTLDHEMRFFVQELGDRNPALDELNRRIDHLFSEHGINIAFNQVEVTLKNVHGDVVNVDTAAGAAGAAASATLEAMAAAKAAMAKPDAEQK